MLERMYEKYRLTRNISKLRNQQSDIQREGTTAFVSQVRRDPEDSSRAKVGVVSLA